MKRELGGIVAGVVALLWGCHVLEEDPPSSLQCGAGNVTRGDCAARCPAPCGCFNLFAEPLPAYQLCGRPCALPGSCPAGERCAYTESSHGPVCIPSPVELPGGELLGIVDCPPGALGEQRECLGGFLVQWQSFGVAPGGEVGGSFCAHVLLEKCAAGCVRPATGNAHCKGGALDAGQPADARHAADAGGPADAGQDAPDRDH